MNEAPRFRSKESVNKFRFRELTRKRERGGICVRVRVCMYEQTQQQRSYKHGDDWPSKERRRPLVRTKERERDGIFGRPWRPRKMCTNPSSPLSLLLLSASCTMTKPLPKAHTRAQCRERDTAVNKKGLNYVSDFAGIAQNFLSLSLLPRTRRRWQWGSQLASRSLSLFLCSLRCAMQQSIRRRTILRQQQGSHCANPITAG